MPFRMGSFWRCWLPGALLILPLSSSHAEEINWVDRYLEGHGRCDQQPVVYQPQPLGLPLPEWTDEDLSKLRAAIAKCEAKYQSERHIPLPWGQLVYEAVANDVKESRQYNARERAQEEARRTQAQQVALASQHQLEAQERERLAHEDEAAANKKVEDAQAAQALAARKQRDRFREQAELADVQEQARRDWEAADRAKALAAQEAPRIRKIEREATEARQARIEAEKHLDEVRRRGAVADEQRHAEESAAQAAKAKRALIETQAADRKREQREFEALAKVCSVSAEQFERIRVGMSLRDVRQAFGCIGSLSTSTEIQGLGVFSVYGWDGAKSGALATTTFNNNRLVSKSQTALD